MPYLAKELKGRGHFLGICCRPSSYRAVACHIRRSLIGIRCGKRRRHLTEKVLRDIRLRNPPTCRRRRSGAMAASCRSRGKGGGEGAGELHHRDPSRVTGAPSANLADGASYCRGRPALASRASPRQAGRGTEQAWWVQLTFFACLN